MQLSTNCMINTLGLSWFWYVCVKLHDTILRCGILPICIMPSLVTTSLLPQGFCWLCPTYQHSPHPSRTCKFQVLIGAPTSGLVWYNISALCGLRLQTSPLSAYHPWGCFGGVCKSLQRQRENNAAPGGCVPAQLTFFGAGADGICKHSPAAFAHCMETCL